MKESHIREWGENKCRFQIGTYSQKKRKNKLKAHVSDESCKLKSKLVVILRNIQHFTGTVNDEQSNEQSCQETPYKKVL